jgi:phosphorylcholine metabolism protein LicD
MIRIVLLLCVIMYCIIGSITKESYTSKEISSTQIRNFKNDKTKLMNFLLKEVVNVLKDNNIPYYLDCGTLLGCIRDNSLMKKDTDIDLTIHLSMWDNLKKIDFEKYGLIRTRVYDKKRGNLISVKTKYSNFYCDIYANPAFPLLTEKKLNNELYSIPVDPELYLTQLYGNWKVPSGKHADWPNLFYKNNRLITSDYSKNWDSKYKIMGSY